MAAKPEHKGGNAAKAEQPRAFFTDSAYREIKRQILSGEMPAGFQITEQELAERLNMSRTPTRQAMLRVEQEGLVEIWSRHGMRVRLMSLDDIRDLYDIISPLEAIAAGIAAAKGPPAALIREMRSCVARMDAALASDDLERWADADVDFHRLLVKASGNDRMIQLFDLFNAQAHRVRRVTLRMRPKPVDSNRDHEAVIDAICSGDAEAAETIHRAHRERSGHQLIGMLEQKGITSL